MRHGKRGIAILRNGLAEGCFEPSKRTSRLSNAKLETARTHGTGHCSLCSCAEPQCAAAVQIGRQQMRQCSHTMAQKGRVKFCLEPVKTRTVAAPATSPQLTPLRLSVMRTRRSSAAPPAPQQASRRPRPTAPGLARPSSSPAPASQRRPRPVAARSS